MTGPSSSQPAPQTEPYQKALIPQALEYPALRSSTAFLAEDRGQGFTEQDVSVPRGEGFMEGVRITGVGAEADMQGGGKPKKRRVPLRKAYGDAPPEADASDCIRLDSDEETAAVAQEVCRHQSVASKKCRASKRQLYHALWLYRKIHQHRLLSKNAHTFRPMQGFQEEY